MKGTTSSLSVYSDLIGINLSEITDPITQHSLVDLFKSAQDNFIPYYQIGVLQFDSPGEKPLYEVYDGIGLHLNMLDNLSRGEEQRSPLTRKEIQKVHYLALRCFHFVEELNSFEKIENIDGPIERILNLQHEFGETNGGLFFDALNHHFLESGEDDQAYLRKTQKWLALQYKIEHDYHKECLSDHQKRVRRYVDRSIVTLSPYGSKDDEEKQLSIEAEIKSCALKTKLWDWCCHAGILTEISSLTPMKSSPTHMKSSPRRKKGTKLVRVVKKRSVRRQLFASTEIKKSKSSKQPSLSSSD